VHITNKASRHNIDDYIFKLIDQAQEKQFKIIIMGDFNSNPDMLEDLLDNGSKVHWRYNLLMRLKYYGFLNSYHCFHDSGGSTWSDKHLKKPISTKFGSILNCI